MTQNWGHELVAKIAGAVRARRDELGLSAAKLSDRTADAGMRITRSVIADLENGRKRSLDISELIVLASALEVPPLQLIYPDLPHGLVQAWPGERTTSIDAAQWFSGEIAYAFDEDRRILLLEPDSKIGLARDLFGAEIALRTAELRVASAAAGRAENDDLETAEELLGYKRDNLIRILEANIRAGGDVSLRRFPSDIRADVAKRLEEDPNERARRVAREIREGL